MSEFFSLNNLEELIKQNPDSILFAHLAARFVEETDYQKAIDVCNKGIEKHPNYAFGHFILGLAHYHIKNYTDAKRELETALAHDPASPKAWDVLSTINEILNLSDDANETNLNSYLIDYFNKDASISFLPPKESPSLETPGKVETQEMEEIPPTEAPSEDKPASQIKETIPEVSESEVENILDDVVTSDETEYDFQKTLNEVFKEDQAESKIKEQPPVEPTSEVAGVDPKTEQKVAESSAESTKEDMVSADEFTAAIESFFSEYEEKAEVELDEVEETASISESPPSEETPEVKEQVVSEEPSQTEGPPPTNEVAETEETLAADQLELSQQTPPLEQATPAEEEPQPVTIEPPADQDLNAFELEQLQMQDVSPEQLSNEQEGESEGLMDISSVVSDFIEGTEEAPAAESQSPLELDSLPTENDFETGLGEEPEQVIEQPQEMAPEPELPPTEELSIPEVSEADVDLAEDTMSPNEMKKPDLDLGSEMDKSAKTKTAKPPILSPTLGEIYIAQGRFDEAINVFQELLAKDTQNTRYQRKIDDLEQIIAKKQGGAK